MKSLLFFISILVSFSLFSQSDQCEFPDVWEVDQSNVFATQIVRDENGDRTSDTLDINRFDGKYELPDSAVFNKGVVSLFFTNGGKVRVVEGKYKLSEKKFSFKAKSTSLASTKYTFGRDNPSCRLIEEGILFAMSMKENNQNIVFIKYYLIPKD